jgi:hypothetical protein
MQLTASEFAFLALGLVLGVASGAALSIVIRARPPAPREIRVTVSTDAVPRRPPATLSGLVPPGTVSAVGAARGGPADPSILAADGAGDRTPVRSAPDRAPLAIPIRPEPDPIFATNDDALAAPASRSTGAR